MLKFLSFAAALLALTGPALAAPGDQPGSMPPGTVQSAQAPSAPSGGRGNSGVMRYDTNKDGAVDRNEWKAGQEARFKQLDANGDGKLSQEELFARTPSTGSSVLPTDRQTSRQTGYFQRLDADKDGAVTLVEFMAQGELNFSRCDLDKNGRIDTAECRQALQRRPTER